MEMRLLYTLLIVLSAAMTLMQGGWNISDIHIQFILNLGNYASDRPQRRSFRRHHSGKFIVAYNCAINTHSFIWTDAVHRQLKLKPQKNEGYTRGTPNALWHRSRRSFL